MRQYALIPENQITTARAAKFQVVTDQPSTLVFASHIVTDASGQESEIYDDNTLARWIESLEKGFTAQQDTEITSAVAAL